MRLLVTGEEFVVLGSLAAFLLLRVAWSISLHRTRNSAILQRKSDRWQRRPAWLLPILILTLALAVAGLAKTCAAEIYRRVHQPSENMQIALPLRLHIPSVSSATTYTVVAKFRVKGRPYTSSPLQIRFAAKRPYYPLILYYDGKDPARNSWSKLQVLSAAALLREALLGLLCLLLAHFSLEWLEHRSMKSRTVIAGLDVRLP